MIKRGEWGQLASSFYKNKHTKNPDKRNLSRLMSRSTYKLFNHISIKKVCNFHVFNEKTFVILSFLGINNSAYLRIPASTKTEKSYRTREIVLISIHFIVNNVE